MPTDLLNLDVYGPIDVYNYGSILYISMDILFQLLRPLILEAYSPINLGGYGSIFKCLWIYYISRSINIRCLCTF
jgi:hypothetical protein